MSELSLYLPGILLAYSAFLLAIASPGPNILAVIGTSMAVGRPSGVVLACCTCVVVVAAIRLVVPGVACG